LKTKRISHQNKTNFGLKITIMKNIKNKVVSHIIENGFGYILVAGIVALAVLQIIRGECIY